jgi:hypothetical protein
LKLSIAYATQGGTPSLHRHAQGRCGLACVSPSLGEDERHHDAEEVEVWLGNMQFVSELGDDGGEGGPHGLVILAH